MMSTGNQQAMVVLMAIYGLFALMKAAHANRLQHVKLCHLQQNELVCHTATDDEIEMITFPDESCMVQACGLNCEMTAWKDYVLTDDNELVRDAVIWTDIVPTSSDDGRTVIYECTNKGVACVCGEPSQPFCNGSEAYCTNVQCDNNTQCYCNTSPGVPQWNIIRDNEVTRTNRILSIQECSLYRKSSLKARRPLSVIREEEETTEPTDDLVFSENNVTVRFVAPLFHVSCPGVMIIRALGYEQIHAAKGPRLVIEVPHLFLETTNRLQFVFIDHQGKVISGQFLVKGSTYCRKVRDIWSMDAVYSIRCLPTTIQYIVLTGAIIMTGLSLIYVKNVIKLIISTIKSIIFIARQTVRLFKGTARATLIGGHIAGNSVNAMTQRVRVLLENLEAPPRANLPLTTAVLLLGGFVTCLAQATGPTQTCTSNEVIKSEISTCYLEGTKRQCEIKTTVQIYLNNLLHTTCLYLEDPKEGHMITVSVTLLEVKCEYMTTRNYFTFPVQLRTIIDIFCSQSDRCGWTVHCQKNRRTPGTSTPESLEFAGENACKPAPFSRGCPLLHNNCFFYRNFLKPDYEKAYEVRRVTTQTCSYLVQIKEQTTNSTEILTVKNIGTTKSGLRVHIFGSLQQTNVALADLCLISRVGDATESYIGPCAPPSFPRKGEIGFVQANASLAKQFLYDSGAITCEVFEEDIECELLQAAIDNIAERQELKLPKAIAMHNFDVTTEGNLYSTALTTAPVLLSLKFKDYKISLKLARVCPMFETTSYQSFGCYNCDFFSKLVVIIYSKCEEGQVSVQCDSLHVATPTVFLSNTPQEATILFKSNARCVKDNLCLISQYGTKCIPINFCLQPPEVILRSLNSTIHRVALPVSLSSIWKNFFDWPQLFSIGNIAHTLIYVGAGTFGLIFIISAITTCCRR